MISKLKRTVVILSLFILLINIFPVQHAFAVNASSGVQEAINKVMMEYPSGSYFTVNGYACNHNSYSACYNCSLYGILNAKNINIPNGQGNGWTCNAFAQYVYIRVFGTALNRYQTMSLTSEGLLSEISTFSKAQIGDVVLFYVSKSSKEQDLRNYKHMAIFMGLSDDGSSIYLYDDNTDGTNQNVGHVKYYNAVPGNGARMPHYNKGNGYCMIYHANNYSQIDADTTPANTSGTQAPHTTHVKGSYLWCEKAHPHYNYWTCSVCGQRFTDGSTSTVESCAACGTVEPPAAVTEITFSGLTVPGNLTEGNGGHVNGYIYSSNSPICSVTAKVYNESGQISLSASSRNFSVSKYGPIKNSKIDKDLKFETLSAGTYHIQYTAEAEDGTTATAVTDSFTITGQLPAHTAHEKGTYLWCEAAHPHNNYYICSVCGEKFTDGSTSYVESCATCNPPQDTEIIEEPSEPETTVGPWSEWSATPAYASDTRQVETRQVQVSDAYTEYRYGRYVDAPGRNDCWCAKYLESLPYVSGSAILQYSGWSTSRYGTSGKDWSCGYCSGSHTGVDHTGSDGRAWWHEYLLPGGSYYWEESRTVPAVYETQYRYRDRIG